MQYPGISLFYNGAHTHAVPTVFSKQVTYTHTFGTHTACGNAIAFNQFLLNSLGTAFGKFFVECKRTVFRSI